MFEEDGGDMKAWLAFDYDPHEGCVLIFAETRGRAKTLCLGTGFFDEYIALSAIRKPEYDKYALEEKVMEGNDELPDGAPTFFNEGIY